MLIYTRATYKPRRKSKKVVPKAPKFKKKFEPLKSSPHRPVSSADSIKSLDISELDVTLSMPLRYEGEMADREKVAQAEIERKKKMTAPIANKMGYQYIGDMPSDVIATLGRKV